MGYRQLLDISGNDDPSWERKQAIRGCKWEGNFCEIVSELCFVLQFSSNNESPIAVNTKTKLLEGGKKTPKQTELYKDVLSGNETRNNCILQVDDLGNSLPNGKALTSQITNSYTNGGGRIIWGMSSAWLILLIRHREAKHLPRLKWLLEKVTKEKNCSSTFVTYVLG